MYTPEPPPFAYIIIIIITYRLHITSASACSGRPETPDDDVDDETVDNVIECGTNVLSVLVDKKKTRAHTHTHTLNNKQASSIDVTNVV